MNPSPVSRILRRLPREKAFYFFTSVGNYIGEKATSIEEFRKKVGEVNETSLEFHLKRGDFGKWIAKVLEDAELAETMKELRELRLAGDSLRDRLSRIVSERFEKLKKLLEEQTTR